MPIKVKICCFCEKWESGGIESFLNNIIQRIDLEKFQIDIIAVCLGKSIFTGPLENIGVRFFELSGSQRRLIQNHRLFFDLLCQEQYHVVHFNLYHGLSLSYLETAKRASVPVQIVHSHNAVLRRSATKPLKLLIHSAAKYIFADKCTTFWSCSQGAAEFLFPKRALKKRGYQFIPNGIETERFRFNCDMREKTRTELGLEGRFVIGNVGRLCYQKNQAFLLDVFAQVHHREPNSCLLLVGEGDLLDHLKKKAHRLGVAGSVIFYGVSSHVERLLWAMDVFVLPSRFEGLPVTGVEAQAAGLPCFFSDAVTRECALTDSALFLPLAAGATVWADTIIAKCESAGRRSRADAAKVQMFSADSVAREIQAFYAGTVEAGREKELK